MAVPVTTLRWQPGTPAPVARETHRGRVFPGNPPIQLQPATRSLPSSRLRVMHGRKYLRLRARGEAAEAAAFGR